MNEALTVASAKLAKQSLEKSIAGLLDAFTKETGLRIQDLSVTTMDLSTMTATDFRHSVRVELRL